MKKIKYLFMAVIMAWAIQICIVGGVNETQAATTSTATTVTEKKNGLYKEKGKNYRFSVMGAMANGVISVGRLALILMGL